MPVKGIEKWGVRINGRGKWMCHSSSEGTVLFVSIRVLMEKLFSHYYSDIVWRYLVRIRRVN